MTMLFNFSLLVILPLLAIAILMTFLRLVRGPSLADRVIALDLLASIGIGLIGVHALVTGQAVFLDVAILFALVSFLGTIAFAYYVERGVQRQEGAKSHVGNS